MALPSSAERVAGRAPYLPFAAGGSFRLSMGLMPLAEAAWFEIDDGFAEELARKRTLLAARHGEVFAPLPAADEPAAELLALVAAHLPHHHPAYFSGDGRTIENRVTGERWTLPPALHPLDLCGRLVQEDFCILVAAGETFVLAGASLCSPARWRLADKLGRPLAALHAPVPGYDAVLARPVDRFFAHLKPGRLVWRLNWGIFDHPARFQPTPLHGQEAVTAARAGELLWLRVERQTLRRLPATGAVVFTIRTHITRLDAAIAGAAEAHALAEAVRTMPPEMQRYKEIAPFAPALLAWLERTAS